ncbi:MAG: hypothetical protein M1816_002722 [Peltula sp. TS41687]|nr:MAG: hypothetical protein M1816_002722 [Peltula sp. TS41687]
MPLTAITFLPDLSASPTPTYQTLLDRITKLHNHDHPPTPLLPRPWTLNYQVMRETSTAVAAAAAAAAAANETEPQEPQPSTSASSASTTRPPLLQILTLPHFHPGRSFIGIGGGGGGVTNSGTAPQQQPSQQQRQQQMIAIPSGTQTEEMALFLRTRLGPLWTSRHTMAVGNGVGFELEDFRVRFGDLRIVSRAQTGTGVQGCRGVVLEVVYLDGGGAGDRGAGEQEEEGVLRAFWERLEVGKWSVVGREGGGGDGLGLGLPRLWCEVLRLS